MRVVLCGLLLACGDAGCWMPCVSPLLWHGRRFAWCACLLSQRAQQALRLWWGRVPSEVPAQLKGPASPEAVVGGCPAGRQTGSQPWLAAGWVGPSLCPAVACCRRSAARCGGHAGGLPRRGAPFAAAGCRTVHMPTVRWGFGVLRFALAPSSWLTCTARCPLLGMAMACAVPWPTLLPVPLCVGAVVGSLDCCLACCGWGHPLLLPCRLAACTCWS